MDSLQIAYTAETARQIITRIADIATALVVIITAIGSFFGGHKAGQNYQIRKNGNGNGTKPEIKK